MSETPPKAGAALRVGAFTAACLLVSNMIGTGIFGSTGFMAADLGSPVWILALWAAGGVYALLGAASYAELGTSLPRAGGEYVYIREAFGPLPGFLSGWTSLTIGFSAAIAANADLFAAHMRELVPALSGETVVRFRVLELGLVWALTLVHTAGLAAGGLAQRLLTIVKVGAILLLVLGGFALGKGSWSHLGEVNPDVTFDASTALVSFLFVTFAYSGWNAVAYIASEVREPQRGIPRSMLLGTLCVAVMYVALNLVYLYALPVTGLDDSPIELVGHRSAQALFGSGVGRFFTAFLAISIVGATSAMIWAGPRVYYSMASDGVFPQFFAARSESSGVPVRSIVLQSLWITVLVLMGTFQTLVVYSSFVLILFTSIAVGGMFVLRRNRPDLERPYRTWGYPVVPALFILISMALLWAALKIRPQESMYGLLTVAGGVPFFLFWNRKRA